MNDRNVNATNVNKEDNNTLFRDDLAINRDIDINHEEGNTNQYRFV